MKLIAQYFFILLTLILFNCKGENNTQINLNGYYGNSKYFQSKNTNADYIETFLLKIENKKIIIFGTVNTWGRQYKYMLNKSNDTILLENNFKIYRKSNNDNVIYFERCIENKIEKTEYQKIPNIEKVIDESGINSNRLSDFLNKTLIVGKYKFKDKIIIFKENGKVVNLENFNNYRIRPRLGTNTYYDDRIIETEKGIWKYQKKNGNLILTKYSNKRDEYEMFILSDEKIELEKITSP